MAPIGAYVDPDSVLARTAREMLQAHAGGGGPREGMTWCPICGEPLPCASGRAAAEVLFAAGLAEQSGLVAAARQGRGPAPAAPNRSSAPFAAYPIPGDLARNELNRYSSAPGNSAPAALAAPLPPPPDPLAALPANTAYNQARPQYAAPPARPQPTTGEPTDPRAQSAESQRPTIGRATVEPYSSTLPARSGPAPADPSNQAASYQAGSYEAASYRNPSHPPAQPLASSHQSPQATPRAYPDSPPAARPYSEQSQQPYQAHQSQQPLHERPGNQEQQPYRQAQEQGSYPEPQVPQEQRQYREQSYQQRQGHREQLSYQEQMHQEPQSHPDSHASESTIFSGPVQPPSISELASQNAFTTPDPILAVAEQVAQSFAADLLVEPSYREQNRPLDAPRFTPSAHHAAASHVMPPSPVAHSAVTPSPVQDFPVAPAPTQPGPVAPPPIQSGPAAPGQLQSGQLQSGQHQSGQHQSGQFQSGQHQSGQHQSGQDQSGQDQSSQFQSEHGASGHGTSGLGASGLGGSGSDFSSLLRPRQLTPSLPDPGLLDSGLLEPRAPELGRALPASSPADPAASQFNLAEPFQGPTRIGKSFGPADTGSDQPSGLGNLVGEAGSDWHSGYPAQTEPTHQPYGFGQAASTMPSGLGRTESELAAPGHVERTRMQSGLGPLESPLAPPAWAVEPTGAQPSRADGSQFGLDAAASGVPAGSAEGLGRFSGPGAEAGDTAPSGLGLGQSDPAYLLPASDRGLLEHY